MCQSQALCRHSTGSSAGQGKQMALHIIVPASDHPKISRLSRGICLLSSQRKGSEGN